MINTAVYSSNPVELKGTLPESGSFATVDAALGPLSSWQVEPGTRSREETMGRIQ